MNIRVLAVMAFVILLTGCGDLLGPDKEGWKSSQKSDFIDILKTDKYMSICNQKAMSDRVISSENSKLMTKMLVVYAPCQFLYRHECI